MAHPTKGALLGPLAGPAAAKQYQAAPLGLGQPSCDTITDYGNHG
jgi:hypothetical protein